MESETTPRFIPVSSKAHPLTFLLSSGAPTPSLASAVSASSHLAQGAGVFGGNATFTTLTTHQSGIGRAEWSGDPAKTRFTDKRSRSLEA